MVLRDARWFGYRQPLVRQRDETPAIDCPFGHVQRVVTGDAGGVANLHVVRVTRGSPHVHAGYDEVHFALSGRGTMTLDQETDGLLEEIIGGA